jgi:hypothetical protein
MKYRLKITDSLLNAAFTREIELDREINIGDFISIKGFHTGVEVLGKLHYATVIYLYCDGLMADCDESPRPLGELHD